MSGSPTNFGDDQAGRLALEPLGGLSTELIVIGPGKRADCVWTRAEFLDVCEYLLNGNPPTEFLLCFQDKQGQSRFCKARNSKAERRASWAWDTIIDRAKSPIGIGFYPSNRDGLSRWGAMDFDAHDGDALRARGYALSAFQVLRRHLDLSGIVLGTSGTDGWHLFGFTENLHPVADWARLLKNVVAIIGAELRPGVCEIFPCDPKPGSLGFAIRAPGSWNPKTGRCGLIVFSNFCGERRIERDISFSVSCNHLGKNAQLHDREKSGFYRGQDGAWKFEFAITAPAIRHQKLKDLVHMTFRQVSQLVARGNAAAQYQEALPQPRATEAEHLSEFEKLWEWTEQRWLAELPACELEHFNRLPTGSLRDAFRIIRNFARDAAKSARCDFPIGVSHLGLRLRLSYQAASKVRKGLVELGIIEQTTPARTNVAAARFRWLAGIDQPF